MSFSSLFPTNSIHLDVNPLNHSSMNFPDTQNQQHSISDILTSQVSGINHQTDENLQDEDEISEVNSITNIFLQIEAEFHPLPKLEDSIIHEVQYKLSSDDLGHEGLGLLNLKSPSIESASASSTPQLADPIITDNQEIKQIQHPNRKRKAIQNIQENKINDQPAKKLKESKDKPQDGEVNMHTEVTEALTKSEINKDSSYEEESAKLQGKKVSNVNKNIKEVTNKTLEIFKKNFPQKANFRMIMTEISKYKSFSSESEKIEYVDCINKLFTKLLSDQWKARFISALSMNYNMKKINFLKIHVVSLLEPKIALILKEVIKAYKPGGTKHLYQALKKISFSYSSDSIKSLTNLFKIVIQYAKNLSAGQRKGNTSSYINDVSNLFATLDGDKIRLLNATLKGFSIKDLNLLVRWVPKIKKNVGREIAKRISV